jgi:hypothetical protein
MVHGQDGTLPFLSLEKMSLLKPRTFCVRVSLGQARFGVFACMEQVGVLLEEDARKKSFLKQFSLA